MDIQTKYGVTISLEGYNYLGVIITEEEDGTNQNDITKQNNKRVKNKWDLRLVVWNKNVTTKMNTVGKH